MELNKFIGINKLKHNVLNQLLYFLQDLHIFQEAIISIL